MKQLKLYFMTALFLLITLICTTKVEASLQAKPGVTSLVNQTANQFFEKIRLMEAKGGTLGLDANIDSTTYLDSSNNGVDVHMAKNTEWGTAAMLAASIYGEAPIGKSDATTTGNSTGIYQMADGTYEYVAGIYNTSDSDMNKIKGADERYRNLYVSTTSITGDATTETEGWRLASKSGFVVYSLPIFLRSFNGLFSYDDYHPNSDSERSSRACFVIATGL